MLQHPECDAITMIVMAGLEMCMHDLARASTQDGGDMHNGSLLGAGGKISRVAKRFQAFYRWVFGPWTACLLGARCGSQMHFAS